MALARSLTAGPLDTHGSRADNRRLAQRGRRDLLEGRERPHTPRPGPIGPPRVAFERIEVVMREAVIFGERETEAQQETTALRAQYAHEEHVFRNRLAEEEQNRAFHAQWNSLYNQLRQEYAIEREELHQQARVFCNESLSQAEHRAVGFEQALLSQLQTDEQRFRERCAQQLHSFEETLQAGARRERSEMEKDMLSKCRSEYVSELRGCSSKAAQWEKEIESRARSEEEWYEQHIDELRAKHASDNVLARSVLEERESQLRDLNIELRTEVAEVRRVTNVASSLQSRLSLGGRQSGDKSLVSELESEMRVMQSQAESHENELKHAELRARNIEKELDGWQIWYDELEEDRVDMSDSFRQDVPRFSMGTPRGGTSDPHVHSDNIDGDDPWGMWFGSDLRGSRDTDISFAGRPASTNPWDEALHTSSRRLGERIEQPRMRCARPTDRRYIDGPDLINNPPVSTSPAEHHVEKRKVLRNGVVCFETIGGPDDSKYPSSSDPHGLGDSRRIYGEGATHPDWHETDYWNASEKNAQA